MNQENESLRNELRRKDILINSIEVDNPSFRPNFHQDCVFDPRWRYINETKLQIPRGNKTNKTFQEDFEGSVEYEIPKKRQTQGTSPKPTWEPISLALNRYVENAGPALESTYSTAGGNPKPIQNSAEFQTPKKCHTTKMQSPKPSWEPIDVNLNRYSAIARPSAESTYTTAVKNTSEFQKTKKDAEQNLRTRQEKISDKQEKYKHNRTNTNTRQIQTQLHREDQLKSTAPK